MKTIDLTLPEAVPAMMLGGSVLFPHASMPLYIFEERYRQMLSAVSDGPGFFAIATCTEQGGTEEAIYPVGTVGLVQAIQREDDGTSHILLSGVARVRFLEPVSTEPFPIFRIAPLTTRFDLPKDRAARKRRAVLDLVRRRLSQVSDDPESVLRVLDAIAEPEVIADLVSYGFISKVEQRIKLVSMESLGERMDLLLRALAGEINETELAEKLRQGLDEDRIGLN